LADVDSAGRRRGVASRGDANICADDARGGHRAPSQWGAPIKLRLRDENLWSICAGQSWDPDVHSLDELRSSPSEWLFRLPEPFVNALVNTASAAVDKVANV
jgi:hypothetical protein